MLSFFRSYKERAWHTISAQDYADAWQRFGGSVATHPEIIARLSAMVDIPVRYLAFQDDAAVACWEGSLALSKTVLKKHKKRQFFDLGNAEIIIPQAANSQISLPHKAEYISCLHDTRVTNLSLQKEGLALARAPEDYSRKFRYNQRREQRILEENGGIIRPVSDFPSNELATLYADLFQKRWGFAAKGEAHLAKVFAALENFMTGSVIFIDEKPAAIQVLYRTESPDWISVEYINGGVDPELNQFSPGSVLSFINTQNEWQYARDKNKTLRYSFGRADREYKDRWCHKVNCFKV